MNATDQFCQGFTCVGDCRQFAAVDRRPDEIVDQLRVQAKIQLLDDDLSGLFQIGFIDSTRNPDCRFDDK